MTLPNCANCLVNSKDSDFENDRITLPTFVYWVLFLVLILIKRLYRDSLTYTSLITFNCSDQYFTDLGKIKDFYRLALFGKQAGFLNFIEMASVTVPTTKLDSVALVASLDGMLMITCLRENLKKSMSDTSFGALSCSSKKILM
ncbi:hypothetical protein BCV71DRAFT_286255 [Rhizopus microsporus]|uniref:Uncharacterized protein n=1 Tax=Rhizopus microsporus TaxID=58291 RepID=A0A1X0S0T5_RHIZD|nr:hypothetical protein BCV71DRAFT_286255 [Rhizopus microsporus]